MFWERQRERLGELLRRPPGGPPSREVHLAEVLAWLYRAQDAGEDRGVSHSYELGRGWLPSYPETTGYIIPTLLNVSSLRGDPGARRRALEMAEWELQVQRDDGSIADLARARPCVFDTGQVVFGWLAAFQATGEARFLAAAERAGRWLVEVMDGESVWRREVGSAAGVTFHARVAWALAELAGVTGEEPLREAARRFLDWSLRQEERPGWFGQNCLTDNRQPLLHTIAYTARGQFEAGILLEEPSLVAAATRTARALTARVDRQGRMSGRFDREWRGTVPWACLTGMAQVCVLWSRLYAHSGERIFAEQAERVLGFLERIHDLRSSNPGLRGGVRGSFPINGAYCRYRLPNWATKFFADALIFAPSATVQPTYKG